MGNQWARLRMPAPCRREHWSPDDATGQSQRMLTGEAGLEGPLIAQSTIGPMRVHTLTLTMAAVSPPPKGRFFKVSGVYSGVLSASAHRDTGAVEAHLHVWLPLDIFERLWASAAPSMDVRLAFELVSPHESGDILRISPQDAPENCQVLVQRVEGSLSAGDPKAWLVTQRQRQLQETLKQLYIPGWGNQVAQVCAELSAGLATIDDPAQRHEQTQAAMELVRDARLAMHLPMTGTKNTYFDNAFALTVAEFNTHIAQFDDKRQKELQGQYNLLWKHFTVADAIRHGEEATGATKAGYSLNRDEFDGIVARYAALPWACSPTLEWALLDALVHSECLGLAQMLSTDQAVLGMPVPKPLAPQNHMKKAGRELRRGLATAVFECIALAATYALAVLLTQDNAVATWVVMTGITAARWVRNAVAPRAPDPLEKLTALLGKMVAVSELFKTNDFNAFDARRQIHELTSDGAAFTPWVLNLLDKRIQREN